MQIDVRMPGAWDDVGAVVAAHSNDHDIIVGLNKQERSITYSATLQIINMPCAELYIDSYWVAKDNNYYSLP
tara:strand:- start:498 stop:713 length:216 start_codon:yes stop_codon:yes gene_type:complete